MQYDESSEARMDARHGQEKMPYASALLEQAPLQFVRAQAPGHGGVFLPEEFLQLARDYGTYDVSVMRGVDLPLLPGTKSPLQAAEELCAELFGARKCRFVTTGASGAAKAATLALFEHVGRERPIAVQASCHISVIDALAQSGARVVILPPRVNALGVATVLDPAELERVVTQRHDIGGVIVSTPSYEGAVSEIRRLVEIVHAGDGAADTRAVMVDSSWGSELGLSGHLPESALQAGADLVVGSPHKQLWAPGQSAWVFQGPHSRVSDIDFGGAARAQLSTSKSAPFIAGLDIARWHAARHADALIERSIAAVEEEEDRLRDQDLGHLLVDWEGVDHIPYRALFDLRATGHTGYAVSDMLREQHGVQVAQANVGFICCGFGIGADASIRATFGALADVVRQLPDRPPLGNLPVPPLRLRDIDFSVVPGSGVEVVPFREAVGRLAKFPVGGYPPGFCVLLPGARISEEDVNYLEEIFSLGATSFGPPAEVPAGFVAVIPE